MSLGQNLQYLRKLCHGMTQEELAEKMNVTRQTISKWELDTVYPEMEKVIELCNFFSCSMDKLVREHVNVDNQAYSDIRVEEVPSFKYIRYAVISREPEKDAIIHVKNLSIMNGINQPEIIGWDFPFVSQEQINIYHMHGYAAACILPSGFKTTCDDIEIVSQKTQTYAIITIEEPFVSPFTLIPNAYKTLLLYLEINKIQPINSKEVLSCFEKEYEKNGIQYMDIYLSVNL